jgi:hypothetical protein
MRIATYLAISVLAITLLAAPAQADNFGVIFSGGISKTANWDRYYNNTLRIWQLWTGTLGYDVDKVYVLAADGTDTADDKRTYPSTYSDSDWSAITGAGGIIRDGTPATLESTLEEIDDLFEDEVDCFHFWSFDHGGNTDPADIDNAVLCGWGGDIADNTLASWVEPIVGYAESYWFGQCYAGGMVNDLQALADQDNRFYGWAADWNEPSYGDGWVDALADGIESGLRWTKDLGQYALLNDYYGPSGPVESPDDYLEHPGFAGENFHIVSNQPYVPEPSTLALFGLGAVALLRVRRRRS